MREGTIQKKVLQAMNQKVTQRIYKLIKVN